MIMIFLWSSLLILFILFFLNYSLVCIYGRSEAYITIFECGFDTIDWIINKVRSHFYKLAIIYIIFDIELIYLVRFIRIRTILFYLIIYYFILFRLLAEFLIKTLLWEV